MDSIAINSISGIYQELYIPEPTLLSNPETAFRNKGTLDANMLFWADLLSLDNVTRTTQLLSQKIDDLRQVPIAYKAIVADTATFIKRIQGAKIQISDQGINAQEFFSHIEILNIFCKIYAQLFSEYLTCTIQQGWLLSEDSAQDIYQNCLDETRNPYLPFIINKILPIIKKSMPKVVFLLGRPGYFCFALSRLLKQIDPTVFICVTRHSSEYYSLNKIDFLLKKNIYLFKVFDAIILEHFSSTEKKIIDTVMHNGSIDKVKNIICLMKNGNIQHTGYQCDQIAEVLPNVQRRLFDSENSFHISPHTIANVHLFPNKKCYWNQCNFCGINQKYHFDDIFKAHTKFTMSFKILRELIDDGISKIWFIDEALPFDVMHEIATFFVHLGSCVTWQARCRIESQLLDNDLPELLAKSGLRELRLGLESGSKSTLSKMNKFDDGFSFQLVRNICRRYSDCGVSLHFPMIVGFPSEADSERKLTYELLMELSEEYPLVSFNINIFGLDISSKIFRDWPNFNVQSISFPCEPSFYLGNIVPWHSPHIAYNELSTQRDCFMRERLYSWMPSHAVTQPHVFYRLSETIRNTLVWKEKIFLSTKSTMPTESVYKHQYKTTDLTIFFDDKMVLYYIYSWQSHHYMLGNDCIVMLLEVFKTPTSISNALDILRKQMFCEYTDDDFKKLIEKLVLYQYLVEVKQLEKL